MLCLRIYSLLAVWLAAGVCWLSAQTATLPVARAVEQFRESGGRFEPVNLFTPTSQRDATADRFAPNAQYLQLDIAQLTGLTTTLPPALTIQLPFHDELLTIDLVESSVCTADFSVITNASDGHAVPYLPGRHYRGAIRGDGRSLAAFSFFNGGIMGLLSDDRHGNLVLGKLERDRNESDYILYSDLDVTAKIPFSCETLEPEKRNPEPTTNDHPEVSGCVRVYFESDYELFQNKGSVQATVDYLAGAFNELATLYANEQISVTLSQVFVWVSPDSYSNSSSSSALTQFKGLRTSYNGDIAHLVTIGGNNLGGIAYVGVLCSPAYAYAFSDINTSFNTVPTYSWTVEVLTHEMGHNLGSPHTQSCTWPGGALDNCFTTEGGCAPGPAPVNGGTIMSYCHLTNYGINLNNGFGPLPGNKIRTGVSGASCLAASCTPAGSCTAPKSLSVSSITGSSAVVSWSTVSGATAYSLQWRAVGAASWQSASSATSPYTITGLPANDEIEVEIRSVCGGTNSNYTYGLIFITSASGGGGGGGTSCGAPTNLVTSATSTSSALVTWSAVSGATAYQLSYKTSAAATWNSPVNIGATTYTLNGLTAGTAYNVRVAAVCPGATSGYATANFTTQTAGGGGGGGATCNAPANLVAKATSSTAASVTWSGVSGASYYVFWYKASSATTWSLGLNVTGTSYSLVNLTANTAYDVRVRTVCSAGNSTYSTTSFTTPAAGGGGGGTGVTCPVPTGLTLNYVTATSAIISWAKNSAATGFDLQIKLSTDNYWLLFINLPTTSVQITNMYPNSTYYVKIRTRCSTSTYSDFTPVLTINTPASLGAGNEAALPNGEGVSISLKDPQAAAPVLDLYPNPTTGWVNAQFATEGTGETEFQWFDLNGRALMIRQEDAGDGSFQFDLSQQPPGVYWVRALVKDRQPVVRRVVRE